MKRSKGRYRGSRRTSSTKASSALYSRHTTPASITNGQRSRNGTFNRNPRNLASTSSFPGRHFSKQNITPNHSATDPSVATRSESYDSLYTAKRSSRGQLGHGSNPYVPSSNHGHSPSSNHRPGSSNDQAFSREEEGHLSNSIGGSANNGQSPFCDIVEDNENEVVMALDVRTNSTLGCAYYVAREEKLYLMQDCNMADKTMVETCGF
jgi:DNA mismatch repair protein MSH5